MGRAKARPILFLATMEPIAVRDSMEPCEISSSFLLTRSLPVLWSAHLPTLSM
jgi:hypothetical protein